MDLNNIIERLNQKKYATTQQPGKLDISDLADDEKLAIKDYQPEKSLIIYGSLAPNRPNHSKIKHIKGKWCRGTIKGTLQSKGWGAALGYNGYIKTNTEEDKDIEAFILFSDELGKTWQFLDDFEGDEYERILTVYELENGETGIGNIYALKPDAQ